MDRVVIIGNGITGTTVARHVRKHSDRDVIVISSESPYFYSRTALMYIYMGHMRLEDTKPYEDRFWPESRIELVHDHVDRIDTSERLLHLRSGQAMPYGELVIATGSQSNKFGWPGQDLDGVQGLYSLQDLSLLERNTHDIRRGVIVGGGLIGIEMAEMLRSRNINVTMLVREEHFWDIILPQDEAMLIDRHIAEHHIDLRLATELDAIQGDGNGRVRGVRTKNGDEIACQVVGLTVGVHPNIALLAGTAIETSRGVLVDRTLRTNVPHVWAAGDCAEFREPLPGRSPIEQVWYTGKLQGERLAANILGADEPYRPGVWFNSAKFLDIEYQTYGMVPATLPEEHETFYWEDAARRRCVRINYEKETRAVVGFNFFGARARHEVCEHWIESGTPVDRVVGQIAAAGFDPEFSAGYASELRDAARAHGIDATGRREKRGLAAALTRRLRRAI